VAAQAEFDAAAPDRAYALLEIAEMSTLDELQRARVDVLRAQITFAQGRGSDASALMLAAAKRLEPLNSGLAREAYLEAFGAALFAGRLSGAVAVREVADAARAAGRAGSSLQPPRPLDLLLHGLVTRFTEGYAAGVAPLRRALQTLQAALREHGLVGREVRFAWGVSPELWDDEAWHELASRGVRLARDTALPVGLTYRANLLVFAGEFAAAAALLEEADAIAAATGNAHFDYASPLLAALRGHETEAMEVIEACVQHATARGEGRAIPHAEHASAVLYNGLGRYESALGAAQRACEYEDLGVYGWALVARACNSTACSPPSPTWSSPHHARTPIAVWTERTALAPSPTAAATRFIEPWRTSPTAKTPGTLVSKGRGMRPSAVQVSPSSSLVSWTSVRTKPCSSRATPLSQLVAGSAPMKQKRPRHGC
jgi:tetratricopeptide (TPR) repeat protein